MMTNKFNALQTSGCHNGYLELKSNFLAIVSNDVDNTMKIIYLGIHHKLRVINCVHTYVCTDQFCFVAYFYISGRARKCIKQCFSTLVSKSRHCIQALVPRKPHLALQTMPYAYNLREYTLHEMTTYHLFKVVIVTAVRFQ